MIRRHFGLRRTSSDTQVAISIPSKTVSCIEQGRGAFVGILFLRCGAMAREDTLVIHEIRQLAARQRLPAHREPQFEGRYRYRTQL
jgi:hypothetical protein